MLQIFSTSTKISWQKVWWNVSFCVRRWESLQLELIENCSPVIEQWCDLRPVFIWPCMLGHHPSSHSQLEQTGDTNMLWPLRTAVLQHCSLKINWHIFSHYVLKLKQTKCPLFPIILWRSRLLFWRQSACDIWACVISLSQHAALQTLCFQARKPRAPETIKSYFLRDKLLSWKGFEQLIVNIVTILSSPWSIRAEPVQPNIFSTR